MTSFRCFLTLAVLLAGYLNLKPAQAQAPTFDRAIACGGSTNSFGGARQVAVDGLGNTIAAGQFNGSTLIGNTLLMSANTGSSSQPTPDVYVAKLDAAGAYVWAAQAGGLGWDYVNGIAVDAAGDVYVTGSFASYSVTFGPNIVLYNSSAASEVFVAKLTVLPGSGSGPSAAGAPATTCQQPWP